MLKDNIEEIRKLRYEQGWSLAEIGERFRCTKERVRQLLGDHSGLITTKRKQEIKNLIVERLNEKPELLDKQLAEKIGCSLGIVKSYREKLNYRPQNYYIYRFWRKVNKGGLCDCWEWQGSKSTGNAKCMYGAISLVVDGKPKKMYAHRLSWEIENGPIPEGRMVLHDCDNTACVNPSHLYIGTAADNMRDRDIRGRGNNRGALSRNQVKQIRDMNKSQGKKARELSDFFGVSYGVIQNVISGRTYKHI